MKPIYIILIVIILIVVGMLLTNNINQFKLPEGESVPADTLSDTDVGDVNSTVGAEHINIEDGMENFNSKKSTNTGGTLARTHERELFITDGVKHSIPIDEILSGGPPKDGIPSIDDPKFISTKDADDFLESDAVGLGLFYKGQARFYPYQVLVWHEIVNDTVAGDPVLVTYCPLCATAIAFNRTLEGESTTFGVSGKLWQSNLLMYNRTDDPDKESLWSQVLGEAVLGEFTGTKLSIVPSDVVRYGEWKGLHTDTEVLSRDTGTTRIYGSDPYDGYYTSESVSFGATFNDKRLHPKEFVLGVEVNGLFKAYQKDKLPVGTTEDSFAGKTLNIQKNTAGVVNITDKNTGSEVPIIGGFWFSWLAVHPETQLYKI